MVQEFESTGHVLPMSQLPDLARATSLDVNQPD